MVVLQTKTTKKGESKGKVGMGSDNVERKTRKPNEDCHAHGG